MMFGLHPWFWAATGWDHVNGGAIAYYLLAMALLTRAAATHTAARWSLAGAGMALAGAIWAHLYMAAFAPLLVLHYVALAWQGPRAAPARSLARFCLWAGAGFAVITAPLCLINGLWVDGNFWFWTPSLRTAQAVATNYIWTESLWYRQRLVPYLWLVAASVAIAAVRAPAAWKQAREGRGVTALLFPVQLLAASALMVLLQMRGVTLLGHYYYACYLLPGAFLVLGTTFFQPAAEMDARLWKITCIGATIGFALPWVATSSNPTLPAWAALLLVGGPLTAALVLRRGNYGVWLALAGLAVLTLVTYNGSFREVNIHATRGEYLRVMTNRAAIEQDRRGEPVLFWYDRDEPAFHEYYALNASYMAEFARIGEHFPEGCSGAVKLGTLVVVTSRKPGTPELAGKALSDCWRGAGVKPAVQLVRAVAHPDFPYTMAVLKAVDDFSQRRPLRVNFDVKGRGHLELVPNPTEPRWLPAEMWAASAGANLEHIDGELTLTTPAADTAYAFTYTPLIVPETGRYRFQLRYRLLSGQIAFGAFPADESRWLASVPGGQKTVSGRAMVFELNLEAGETVLLRIANNNSKAEPSRFVLLDASVALLAPPR